MKSLYVVYSYSLNQMDTKIAFAFDGNQFPVKIKQVSQAYNSKSELIEALMDSDEVKAYKTLKILSNEAFNSALDSYNSKKDAVNLFEKHGEEILLSNSSQGNFLTRLFGSKQ